VEGEAVSSIYRKQEALGWGSWSVVSSGRDEMQGRTVAIKELAKPFAGSAPFVRAYFSKARKLVGLSHPNLLTTYAVDSEGEATRVIRDLADGVLGSQLVRGPLAANEMVFLLQQLLPALESLHQRDILHGALKPENIFRCGEDFKLGDFGLPPIEGAPPLPLRRRRYSSPEEENPELLRPASDLYSLGVTAYELLLGPIPLEKALNEALISQGLIASKGEIHREVDELWWQFHRSPLEFPLIHELDFKIPVALSLTLQRMVRKSCSERAVSCKEILMALGPAEAPPRMQTIQFFEPPEVSTPPPVALRLDPATPSQPSPRSWRFLLAGVASAALLGIAGTWVVSRNAKPMPPVSVEAGVASAPQPVHSNLFLGLESEHSGSVHPVVRLAKPLLFRVASTRRGYLLLYSVASDGEVVCLYPSQRRPNLEIATGQTLFLPFSQDREQGFRLMATEPAGTESVFLLWSAQALPTLPPTSHEEEWLRTYATQRERKAFQEWVYRLLREPGRKTQWTELKLEIVP
jgi:serine/threonine protein kinase